MSYKVRARARRVNVTAVIVGLVTEALYKTSQMLVFQEWYKGFFWLEASLDIWARDIWARALRRYQGFAQQLRVRTNGSAREMLPSA